MTRAEKEWEVYSGKYRTYIKTERGLAANTVEAYMRDLRRFRRFRCFCFFFCVERFNFCDIEA